MAEGPEPQCRYLSCYLQSESYTMVRNVILGSIFAALSWASASAIAAPEQRIQANGGSYGFTVYPACSGNTQPTWCRIKCRGYANGYCGHSFQSSDAIGPVSRVTKIPGVTGYTQGKFSAK
jgi:hypothetical protein